MLLRIRRSKADENVRSRLRGPFTVFSHCATKIILLFLKAHCFIFYHKGFCPVRQLPKYATHGNALDAFQMGDKVRGKWEFFMHNYSFLYV